ncbi:hypothetical protein GCM10022255_096630 [Dactylosporangium darangshiense]|uniref:Uncharacterized protein n=1 Tax=Dactylosporangium darangshiense TaxID=579108 RepID=A0ABP8DQN4_9ACTN
MLAEPFAIVSTVLDRPTPPGSLDPDVQAAVSAAAAIATGTILRYLREIIIRPLAPTSATDRREGTAAFTPPRRRTPDGRSAGCRWGRGVGTDGVGYRSGQMLSLTVPTVSESMRTDDARHQP